MNLDVTDVGAGQCERRQLGPFAVFAVVDFGGGQFCGAVASADGVDFAVDDGDVEPAAGLAHRSQLRPPVQRWIVNFD